MGLMLILDALRACRGEAHEHEEEEEEEEEFSRNLSWG